MSSLAARAERDLAVELAVAPTSLAELVERTEVAADGRFLLHVVAGERRRWFAHDGARIEELFPESERALPSIEALLALRDERGREPSILAWRPGRRLVARAGDVAVKLVRRGRAKDARARHAIAIEAARGAFRVPGTIAIDELGGAAMRADDALAFEWIDDAEPLRFAGSLARVEELGRALARMQRAGADVALPAHGRAQELATLDRWAERFVGAAGSLPDGWSALREELDAHRDDGRRPRVLAHRDLHDGQVLFARSEDGDEERWLLDFDLAARAEPELDVENLRAHFDLCGVLGARGADLSRAKAAKEALDAGLASEGLRLDREASRFHRAASALRLSLVHGLRPRGRAATAPLVEIAARALHGGAR